MAAARGDRGWGRGGRRKAAGARAGVRARRRRRVLRWDRRWVLVRYRPLGRQNGGYRETPWCGRARVKARETGCRFGLCRKLVLRVAAGQVCEPAVGMLRAW
jgi:hypothetical protein